MYRLLRKTIGPPLRLVMPVVNRVAGSIEVALSDLSDRPLPQVPVLIVGAPRCGSTLLFQVLTEACEFGYLSNLHCYFHGAPSVVERVIRPSRLRREAKFESTRGRIEGWSAPSECGAFWYRFFRRRPEYVPAAETPPSSMRALRGAMRAFAAASGRPLLFKNLHCSLRLEPTAATLPEALFVFIRRDLLDNAASLLQVRHDVHGSYHAWWSMEPPSITELQRLPPEQQVVEQVRDINAVIEQDRERIGAGRFLDLTYEELCEDPRGTVEKVSGFLSSHGVTVARRTAVLQPFRRRREPAIDRELYDSLEAYVERTSEPAEVRV